MILAGLATVPFAAGAQLSACRTSDIAVEKLTHNVAGDTMRISGQVVNKCPQAVGVHLRVTVYDKTSSPIMVQDLWPASVKNIPAKSSFPFVSPFKGLNGSEKYDVKVLEVKFWPVR